MHPGAVLPPAGVLQPPGVGCRGWPRGAPAPCSRCCLPMTQSSCREQGAAVPTAGLSTSRAGTDTICGIYPGGQTNPQAQQLAASHKPKPFYILPHF